MTGGDVERIDGEGVGTGREHGEGVATSGWRSGVPQRRSGLLEVAAVNLPPPGGPSTRSARRHSPHPLILSSTDDAFHKLPRWL